MTLQEAVKHADEALLALESLGLPSFLQLQNFVWPFLLLGVVLVVALGLSVGWTVGAIGGVVIAAAAGVGSYLRPDQAGPPAGGEALLSRSSRRSTDSERLLAQTEDWVKTEYERKLREVDQHRENEVKKAEDQLNRRVTDAEARQQRDRQEADAKYPARLAELVQKRDAELKQADDHYPPRIKALDEKYDSDNRQLQESHRKTKETTKQLYDQAWNNLIRTWTEGLARVGGIVGEVNEEAVAPVPGLAAHRARPLDAAVGGAAGLAVRQVHRRGLPTSPAACRPIPGSRTPGPRSSSCPR